MKNKRSQAHRKFKEDLGMLTLWWGGTLRGLWKVLNITSLFKFTEYVRHRKRDLPES
jgi:hypothetical protein